jgi:hypothetical protein
MRDVESTILAHAIGDIGGFGARWVAKLLPNVAYKAEFTVPLERDRTIALFAASLGKLGRPIPELPSDLGAGVIHMLVGSGHLDLNPTILNIEVTSAQSGASIAVSAVAKEGLVAQHSARKAVERVQKLVHALA